MARLPAVLLAIGLGLCLGAVAAKAPAGEPPDPGLMWQKTGLPAVFPLHVRSDAGIDHLVTLHDPQGGAALLAAYVRGGEFFRVLVPPGTYVVRLSSGAEWQDAVSLFGSETEIREISVPLTFGVRDAATKSGYAIDLRAERTGPLVTVRNICQGVRIDGIPRPLPPFDASDGYETRLTDPGTLPVAPGARFDPERLTGQDRPTIPSRYAPYFSTPDFEIVDRPC